MAPHWTGGHGLAQRPFPRPRPEGPRPLASPSPARGSASWEDSQATPPGQRDSHCLGLALCCPPLSGSRPQSCASTRGQSQSQGAHQASARPHTPGRLWGPPSSPTSCRPTIAPSATHGLGLGWSLGPLPGAGGLWPDPPPLQPVALPPAPASTWRPLPGQLPPPGRLPGHPLPPEYARLPSVMGKPGSPGQRLGPTPQKARREVGGGEGGAALGGRRGTGKGRPLSPTPDPSVPRGTGPRARGKEPHCPATLSAPSSGRDR